MFKKLHSNRDPRDTVFSEIKKEFGDYFGKAEVHSKTFLERYPKFLFGAMIILIIVSITLSFTVFRNKEKVAVPKQVTPNNVKPVNDGFDQILRTGSALRQTISLKKEVDSITSKTSLTKADSIRLEKDLDKLQQINKQIQPIP